MYSKRAFFLFSVIVIGVIVFAHFRMNPSRIPEFLPNAIRFRTSRVCAPNALLLVNSAPQNTLRRQTIRDTWGHPKITEDLGLSVSFSTGEALEPEVQRTVDWEAETFGDIFQVPFPDTYDTLTRKILHLFRLASNACPEASFVVKVDDDVFVNVFALQKLIQSISSENSEKKIYCLVWQGMPVIRSNRSKWAVTQRQFNESVYPKYCSGSAYILPKHVLHDILQINSEKGPAPFPLEDVYITGLLAREVGVAHQQLGPRYAFESTTLENVVNGKTVFAHLGQEIPEATIQLWNVVVHNRSKIELKKQI